MRKSYMKPQADLLHVGFLQPIATSESDGPEANDQEDPTSPHKAREKRNYSVWDEEE